MKIGLFSRSFRHWTPRYIYKRLGLIWYEYNNPYNPWLTKTAVEILDSWLMDRDVGLEWGSGRSTLWFSQRVKHLTSIEHNKDWFNKLNKQIKDQGIKNIRYLLKAEVESGEISDYVCISEEFENESLDFILVDGQLRDHCALRALPFLKPGGLLILDNANWFLPCKSFSPNSRTNYDGLASANWKKFIDETINYRCIWTSNGVTDTAFWIKPFIKLNKDS